MKRVLTALLFVGLIGGARTASATNIVLNPSFETSDFTDWSQSGNEGFTDVTGCGGHGGCYYASFGPIGSVGYISQDLATTAGDSYDLSFWLQSDGSYYNEADAYWDGNQIFGPTVLPAQDWTEYIFSGLLATGDTTTLTFGFQDDPSYNHLDDIDVEDNGPAAVPEPASLFLLGTGLVGVGLRQWRKARA